VSVLQRCIASAAKSKRSRPPRAQALRYRRHRKGTSRSIPIRTPDLRTARAECYFPAPLMIFESTVRGLRSAMLPRPAPIFFTEKTAPDRRLVRCSAVRVAFRLDARGLTPAAQRAWPRRRRRVSQRRSMLRGAIIERIASDSVTLLLPNGQTRR
jgi:hypothetical protein